MNKGIASTIAKEPSKFFAYDNGIAATASEVTTRRSSDGSLLITTATDLQIVNGAQTTASLATALRDKSLAPATVFVPVKLSVVSPAAGADLIPLISRFANSQNGVRPSDFFANHPFHRRIEELSRRILSSSKAGSQLQTHWYYERASGQYLNDQAGLSSAKRSQFQLVYPRTQVIRKTDLAKVECFFSLEPDVACKGAEKAFVSFAERIAREWEDEAKRIEYGDDWFKAAVARVILFRATEAIVSKASWYESGYRAQIVAYACARLAKLAREETDGGTLDYARIWIAQAPGPLLERQIESIAETMAGVLHRPPLAGQNISEWAKQQACRKTALEEKVPVIRGFGGCIISSDEHRANKRQRKATGTIDEGLNSVTLVLQEGAHYWEALRGFCRSKRILLPDDERALVPACQIPAMIPSDKQAARLLQLRQRAEDAGWQG